MPATAGRVPMPAGNRVVTSAALKVSDRWSSIVGSDPYASEKKPEDQVGMDKLWADQRLHGNKRKIGTDECGRPMFEVMNGAEKREKRKGDAMAAREREYELMQEKKRRMDEVRAAEQELAEASVEACVQGTPTGLTNMSLAGQEHGSSSFLYDYLGEGLPPSPFSPRNRFSARRDARRGGGGGGGTRPARERSRSTETLSTSISSSTLQSSSSFGALDTAGAWADESSLLTFGSRMSSPSTASAVLSRTQSASAFGTPRPWYLQPKALPRRYGAVRAFGSSPSRFPTPRTSFFGCPSTTRGTYDGSTAHLPGGIWSTR